MVLERASAVLSGYEPWASAVLSVSHGARCKVLGRDPLEDVIDGLVRESGVVREEVVPCQCVCQLLRRSLKLAPNEGHIFETVSQELCISDGRSCHIAADGRRPCESARRRQAFSFLTDSSFFYRFEFLVRKECSAVLDYALA